MSTKLPAAVAEGRTALAAQDGPVPSAVRKQALGHMEGVVERLHEIVHDSEAKHQHVVQAGKLMAEIAAVSKTTSLPRDVVVERIQQTAQFLRDQLGDSTYSTLADGLSAIWNI